MKNSTLKTVLAVTVLIVIFGIWGIWAGWINASHEIPSPQQLHSSLPPASFVVCSITTETIKSLVDYDTKTGRPSDELQSRRALRLQSPNGRCDSDPICRDIDRLTDKQLIALTDIVTYYPYRFGDRALLTDAGAVIDRSNCHYGWGYLTPKELLSQFVISHPSWEYDPLCQAPTVVPAGGSSITVTNCDAFPGTDG